MQAFDHLLLRGGPPRSIKLQTRDGWDIPNEVAAEPTQADVRTFALLVQTYGATWVVRKPPTGGYNCAGHVFACRRTGIFGVEGGPTLEAVVFEVLRRDRYRLCEHSRRDPAHAGDIVLYWSSELATRSLLHVGVVTEVRPIHEGGDHMGLPYVLSKWNDRFGECLHHFRHVPPVMEGCPVEFWTDRPPFGGVK